MNKTSGTNVVFKREVGGTDCELTVICEPAEPGGPAVCRPVPEAQDTEKPATAAKTRRRARRDRERDRPDRID